MTKKADSPAQRYRALFSIEILVKTVFIRNLHSFTKKPGLSTRKLTGTPHPSLNPTNQPHPSIPTREKYSHTQKRQIVNSNNTTTGRPKLIHETIAFLAKKQSKKLGTDWLQENPVGSGSGLKFVLEKWKDSSLMPKGYSRALVLGSYCIYIYLPRAPAMRDSAASCSPQCCLLLPLAPSCSPHTPSVLPPYSLSAPPCSSTSPSQATTYAPFPAQKTLIANPQVRDVYNI